MADSVMAGEPILQVTFTQLKYGRETPDEDFVGMSLEQLRSIAEDLQRQIINRPE